MAERKTDDCSGAAPSSNAIDMVIWIGVFIVELVRVSLKPHSVHSYWEIRLICIHPAANVTVETEQIKTVLNI